MVINGSDGDESPITVGDQTINHCDQYCYLGSLILTSSTCCSFIKAHVAEKSKHLLKLYSFVRKKQ